MGYQVRTIDGQLTIAREQHEAAAAALLAALGWEPGDAKEPEANALDLGEDFSNAGSRLLIDLLTYVGFQPDEAFNDERPGTLAIDFYNEKTSVELDATAEALAPYVGEGQYLVWLGEEGETWRWFYTGGEFYLQTPTITWPQVDEEEEKTNG